MDPPYPEVLIFQKRILKHRDPILTFLYEYDVPAHNNASEQAIRNVKVKLKVSGISKSGAGKKIYAIIRSITDTCIKNNQNIINAFITIAKN
ncbi:IS66 family transposase [Sphingobacterium kitahiroshimense]|uniref:IS66 family transposase n=1 Tax=Sphingobacterium kitahiroshimense TaxID=470446 RepID=UPI003D364457